MSGDFWSKRRAAVAAEQEAELAAVEAAEIEQAEAALDAKTDEEILAEKNLPDPDILSSPEEIRAFMSETLPQRLKTRALRRLWRLNPVLANLDGLVDYGEDYTDAATVIENLQTAYQVGKGMLKHVEAMAEAEAAKENAAEAMPEDETTVEDVLALDDAEPEAPIDVSTLAEEPTEPAEVWEDDPVENDYAPRSRRMTFTFEEQRT